MLLRRGSVIIVLLCAVALNVWFLRSNGTDGIAAGISFALVCLCSSWALTAVKSTGGLRVVKRAKAGVIETAPSAPTGEIVGNPILNAFTIDLEDYFHTEVASRAVMYRDWDKMPSRIESSVHRLLDLLDESNTRATVFVLGWVAKKRPWLIREVMRRGHEIGCHSLKHRM